jgi:hypothetical protein
LWFPEIANQPSLKKTSIYDFLSRQSLHKISLKNKKNYNEKYLGLLSKWKIERIITGAF